MKRCKNCGKTKPLSEFNIRRQSRDGLAVRCKTCLYEYSRVWRRQNPDAYRQWCAARDAAKRQQHEWRQQGIKQCGLCQELKPIAEFHVRRASEDGLAYRCMSCVNEVKRQWNLQHPGAHKQWYQENKEHKAKYWREWRENNKDRLSAEYKKWAAANKHIVNALVARRVARKKQAVASWIDHDAVRAIYAQAAELTAQTGIRHEVDHIVPLQGQMVSGLHWEGNLQILTKTENLRKKNKFTADPATC